MSEASHDLNRLLDKPGLGEGPAGYENSFLSFTGAQRLLNGVLSLALVAVMTFRPWVRWRGRFGSISSCARPNASLGLLVPKAGTGRRRSSHRHGSGGYIGWSVTPWGCRHDPRSHDPHRAAAVETGERRTRADRGDGAAGVDPEQEVQQLDQALAVGVEKAEVARAAQPLGQDMAQQQVQEVGARERSGLPAAGAAVLEAEGHLAVVAGEDVLLPDHAAVEIAAEVDQGLLAGADMLAIDHPLFGMRRGQGEPGLGESLEHPGPDSPLQRSADLGGELRVAAHQFLEDRHRAQSRRVLEHRYHFLIEDPGQWVRAPPAPKGLSLGGQSRVRLEAVRRRRAEAGLGGRSGGGVGSSNFHVKPHLVIGYVSPRHRVFLLWSEETP